MLMLYKVILVPKFAKSCTELEQSVFCWSKLYFLFQ